MAAKKKHKSAKKAKTAPKKTAAKKAPRKKPAAKKASTGRKMALAAAPDPMGCCTWTNNAGQIMRRDMRKSQCTFTGAIFVPNVSCT